MNSRVKFALKIYGISLIPLGILIIIFSEPSEIWWRLLATLAYALLWVAVPAYFIKLLYEFVMELKERISDNRKP